MELIRFTLQPRSNFQLTSLGSSMLSRVIIRNLILLYGEEILSEIKVKDTFAVSNLFPWSFSKGSIKNDSSYQPLPITYFLTLPKFDFTQTTPEISQIKKLKQVRFIDQEIFNSFFIDIKDQNTFNWNNYIIKNNLLFKKGKSILLEVEENYLPHAVPCRIKIDYEQDNESSIRSIEQFYHTNTTWYNNGGLYFFLWVPKHLEDKLSSAINLIEDIGLGKRISAGSGGFTIIQKERIQFEDPNENSKSVLLSQCIPSADILNLLEYYSFVQYSPTNPHLIGYRGVLNSITYIASGSVLTGIKNPIIGEYFDIGTVNTPSIAWGKAIVISGGNIGE